MPLALASIFPTGGQSSTGRFISQLRPAVDTGSFAKLVSAGARNARSGVAMLVQSPHRTTRKPAGEASTEPAICATPDASESTPFGSRFRSPKVPRGLAVPERGGGRFERAGDFPVVANGRGKTAEAGEHVLPLSARADPREGYERVFVARATLLLQVGGGR